WSGVNAESARTHNILAAAALARREDVGPRYVFSTRCGCVVGGMQPVSGVEGALGKCALIGWCVIEGAWGTCVSPPVQQLHVLPCLFCCSSADVGFVGYAG
ncbi:hypothetical protein TcCL_ESM08788, partial [Trypanosoma cruzi]